MLTDLIIQTPWKQCNPAEQQNKTDKGGNEANKKRNQKLRKKKKKKKKETLLEYYHYRTKMQNELNEHNLETETTV